MEPDAAWTVLWQCGSGSRAAKLVERVHNEALHMPPRQRPWGRPCTGALFHIIYHPLLLTKPSASSISGALQASCKVSETSNTNANKTLYAIVMATVRTQHRTVYNLLAALATCCWFVLREGHEKKQNHHNASAQHICWTSRCPVTSARLDPASIQDTAVF